MNLEYQLEQRRAGLREYVSAQRDPHHPLFVREASRYEARQAGRRLEETREELRDRRWN